MATELLSQSSSGSLTPNSSPTFFDHLPDVNTFLIKGVDILCSSQIVIFKDKTTDTDNVKANIFFS
ncbi:TPA: hypothetical protein TVG27_000922 [Streptococcus equi subsp. zooepidemicus]|nr:hypothetical protein KVP03_08315 [Streptococcus equi subsp. zooepidemicus]HEL1107763.1 hypothetical protein [Streptococcus equi subsp. zooepidemicus]